LRVFRFFWQGSRFDINAFGSLLHTNYLGRTKIHLPATASTMIDAKNILAEKPPSEAHGSIVIADRQTQAKGRKGRKWVASSIDNIYASFIWVPSQATIPPKTPQQLPTHLIKLNLAVPLAIARACSAEGVSYVGVKWPNDVWINGYKVAGALIDYIGRQGHSGAVVGVGINTNENVKDVLALGGKNKAISIRDALGYPVERERVLAVVLAELEALMKLPLNVVINEFTKLDVLVGNVVTVHHVSKEVKDSRDFQARVLHISQDGLVVTNLKTGDEVTLSSEEVSISLSE